MACYQRTLKEKVQHTIRNGHHGSGPVDNFYIERFAPNDFTQHNALQLLQCYGRQIDQQGEANHDEQHQETDEPVWIVNAEIA